jgi:hypothetical protein
MASAVQKHPSVAEAGLILRHDAARLKPCPFKAVPFGN